jgi:hypothetical protein
MPSVHYGRPLLFGQGRPTRPPRDASSESRIHPGPDDGPFKFGRTAGTDSESLVLARSPLVARTRPSRNPLGRTAGTDSEPLALAQASRPRPDGSPTSTSESHAGWPGFDRGPRSGQTRARHAGSALGPAPVPLRSVLGPAPSDSETTCPAPTRNLEGPAPIQARRAWA